MKKRKKKNIKIGYFIFIIFFSIIFVFLFNTYINMDVSKINNEINSEQSTVLGKNVDNQEEKNKDFPDILENLMKSVVGISKLKENGNSIFLSSNESSLGIGTGIVVASNGYILSNEHVTGGRYSTCYITLENNKKYRGIVVWSDSDLDLSITKIDEKNLTSISLGNSDRIRIGENVYAIGNPIGFEFRRTVTSGIISSKNRSIKLEDNNKNAYMSDLIQTDATINPGNSGGPLIYSNGDVIGINTVKITSAEGIGFAIPINVVKPIIESFKNTDNFEQAYLGIYVYDKNVIPYLNNSINFESGVYVSQINKNGPADGKDLKEGDIITEIDNKKINTMNDLREYIYQKKPNDKITLKIMRGRVNKEVNIELRKKIRN